MEIGALGVVPELDAFALRDLAQAVRRDAEKAGRFFELTERQAAGLPILHEQRPVLALRPAVEHRTGRHGVRHLGARGDEGVGGQLDAEHARGGDDGFADDEDATRHHALDQPVLGPEIGLQLAVTVQMVFVEVGPEHRLGREVAQVLRLERTDLDDGEEGSVGDGPVQRGERQAHVTAGDGVEAGALERERQELGDGRLAVGPGHGHGRSRPEQRPEVELGEAMQAGATGGEQPRMGLRETRAVDEQVMTRGLLGPERAVLAALVVDDRSEAAGGQRFGDGTAAHALAEDGGGPGEPAAERLGEFAHRSLRESSPSRPQRSERIQNRATTFVAGQPFFWKW